MNNQKPNPTEELLSEIYRNVQMGTESLADMVPKVKNPALLSDITAEMESYGRYTGRTEQLMRTHGVDPKPLAMYKKMGAKMGIAMNTATDTSATHLSEMLMQGNHLGSDQLEEQISKCEAAGCAAEVADLGRQVVAFERSEAEKLRKYL